jgi:hypothetical protein
VFIAWKEAFLSNSSLFYNKKLRLMSVVLVTFLEYLSSYALLAQMMAV